MYTVGDGDDGPYLIMEYVSMRRDGDGGALGDALASMHLHEPLYHHFGFPMDGNCGASPQYNDVNRTSTNWVEFWREFRIQAQSRMIKESYPHDQEIQHLMAQLYKMAPIYFDGIIIDDIKPSMLHGDLWSGNFGFDDGGAPVVFDPAGYYGHHEADLGIARMFGGFHGTFWKQYFSRIPPSPGFEMRANLYELYHHINHYLIFGISIYSILFDN